MDVPAPSKPVLALVAAGLVVATIATLVLVVSKDDDPEPSKPSDENYREVPRPAAVPPEPTRKVAPTPSVPTPTTGPVLDARSAAAEVTELLVLARRIESTDPRRARELLLKVLSLDPENETALSRLSNKMIIDERHSSARQLVERCLKVNPSNTSCAAINAQLPNEAAMEADVKTAQECTQRTPDDANCIYTLADQAFLTEKKEAAALITLRLHQVAPEAAPTKYALGRARAIDGAYAEAKVLFDTACKLGNQPACSRSSLLRQEGF